MAPQRESEKGSMVSLLPGCARLLESSLRSFLEYLTKRSCRDFPWFLCLLILKGDKTVLYGKLYKQPKDCLTRKVALEDGTLQPKDWQPLRRVGRPCQRWAEQVCEAAVRAFGSAAGLRRRLDVRGPSEWKHAVRRLRL